MKCPYCNKEISKTNPPSLDHIIPKHRLAEEDRIAAIESGIIITRICCRSCNFRLEHAGECPGALACAVAVANDIVNKLSYPKRKRKLGKTIRQVLSNWRLMYGANL